MLVILRMLLRRRGVAAGAAAIVFLALQAPSAMSSTTPVLDSTFALLSVTVMILILIYLGFLALCVSAGIYQLVLTVPLTTSFPAWYGRPVAWAVALTRARVNWLLAGEGKRAALGAVAAGRIKIRDER